MVQEELLMSVSDLSLMKLGGGVLLALHGLSLLCVALIFPKQFSVLPGLCSVSSD